MSSKHYKEQKMLIENFRKWQAEDLHEEINNQEQLDEISVAGEMSAIWHFIQSIALLLTVPPAVFYTLGPWLKLAVHHPKIQSALAGEDKEKTTSSTMFRALAIGLKSTETPGRWMQNAANRIFEEANAKGKKKGLITQMAHGILLFTFLATLWVGTGLGTIFTAMALRAVPKIILNIRKAYLATKKSAKHYRAIVQGEPTPDELAATEEIKRKELEDLENLEEEVRKTQEAAGTATEVIKIAQQDPKEFMEMYNISMSEEDLKHIGLGGSDTEPETPNPFEKPQRKGTTTKADLPPKRSSIGDRVARGVKAKAKDQE